MTVSRFNDDQIIRLLLLAHDGHAVADLCHRHGIEVDIFHSWRHTYAARLELALSNRLKAVVSENERLKTLAQAGEIRRVTVLLSDLRGFTAMSERYSSLQVLSLLNRYFERMTRIILDHGGTIDKFMGDSIMALFGAPTSHPDEVAQAMACAIEMEIAMESFNMEIAADGMDPLYMGIGINTGDVIAGHLGSSLHSEYTVIGNEVNLASRIEAHTMRGQILISENTYQLAKDYIEIGTVNEVSVKGKIAPVRMYEVLGTKRPRHLKVPQMRESRSSPRVLVDLPVRFQVLDNKIVLPTTHQGNIADLGYGGMRMISTTKLDAFTDLKIVQLQSLITSEQLSMYAKVRRLSGGKDAAFYHLEFTSIDPDSQRMIKAHVDAQVQRR